MQTYLPGRYPELMTNKDTFLRLIRLGIGRESPGQNILTELTEHVDWPVIKNLAAQQGLSAVFLDGLELLEESQRPPKALLLQWIGEVLQQYERRYEFYGKSIAELAGWYRSHGFRMMILKGYACSLDWPQPAHRPCGDIDIWLFGKQKEADALLVKEKTIEIDNSHHHHTVFYWRDIMVENHYDFINTKDLKSSRELEFYFKEMGRDDSLSVILHGERVYLPSPNLNALFLLRHNLLHFVSTSMSLRQILDWGFFVDKHGNEVDWRWLLGVLERFKMKEFFDCLNGICVEDLGFEASNYPYIQFDSRKKELMLEDTLFPRYTSDEPRFLLPRLLYRIQRWRGNEWKQRMCYTDSRAAAFCRSIWAHLIKPATL